jgi:hypothetical protein
MCYPFHVLSAWSVATGHFSCNAFKCAYIRLRMCAIMCALNSSFLGLLRQ